MHGTNIDAQRLQFDVQTASQLADKCLESKKVDAESTDGNVVSQHTSTHKHTSTNAQQHPQPLNHLVVAYGTYLGGTIHT